MRLESWPAWALAALCALAVGVGLFVAGGPGAARAERRDATRSSDLAGIRGELQCRADAGEALPTALPDLGGPAAARCSDDLRLADPYTGAPYGYERLGERRYRVCAGFERPDLIAEGRLPDERDRFDPATGCEAVTLYAPATEAPAAP